MIIVCGRILVALAKKRRRQQSVKGTAATAATTEQRERTKIRNERDHKARKHDKLVATNASSNRDRSAPSARLQTRFVRKQIEYRSGRQAVAAQCVPVCVRRCKRPFRDCVEIVSTAATTSTPRIQEPRGLQGRTTVSSGVQVQIHTHAYKSPSTSIAIRPKFDRIHFACGLCVCVRANVECVRVYSALSNMAARRSVPAVHAAKNQR